MKVTEIANFSSSFSVTIFKSLLPFLLLAGLLLPEKVCSNESLWGDPEEVRRGQVNSYAAEKAEGYFLDQILIMGLLKFYRNFISPVGSGKCPSYPSCSHYALQAIRKHGTLLGLILTFDRLIHEADEVHRAPLIKINGGYRYYDPLENNDFWWYKK